jgi:hypothetical protein
LSELKVVDWGAGLTVVPVPAGMTEPIVGKPTGKMFGIEYRGETTLFYLPIKN